ncbi:hypothetical protein GOP47_0002550 [Adiantum capillus-veneris]|uniref:Uncharacterized protein n=1 Tax=Adiantum capillus-veneris TaxID=13818 RepID=A0A9D4ZRC8_ADICA|nr:hypothetical protein GOP47_0002550 [Adiantum capillus-veneris]
MALGIVVGMMRAGLRRKHRASLNILTSKTGPRNYYKGKNCLSTGRHTSKGKYILIAEKLPKYCVPDLTGFPLKPYVERSTPKDITDTSSS